MRLEFGRRTEPVMTAPLLVLDLDGTLVDTAHDLVATLNVILGQEGVAPLPFAEARGLVGHGARTMLEAGLVASGLTIDPDRIENLFTAFVAYYADHIADHSVIFPGAIASLDRFSANGWQLAICTNKLEGLARQLLAALGIADRFAIIAGQDTYGVRKPDPRHLTETIRVAGGDPSRAIMVGDSDVDVATAKAAAIPIVAVSFGYSAIPVAALDPDRLIDHFDELYGAATVLMRS
jgi:phosphoglycolate phosphatase